MRPGWRAISGALATLLGLTGLLLLLMLVLLRPPVGDLTAMAGFLLASGLTFMVLVYACVNMGVSTGLLPATGLPLPFISYGGSSLLLTLTATGILINVGRCGAADPATLPNATPVWRHRTFPRTDRRVY